MRTHGIGTACGLIGGIVALQFDPFLPRLQLVALLAPVHSQTALAERLTRGECEIAIK